MAYGPWELLHNNYSKTIHRKAFALRMCQRDWWLQHTVLVRAFWSELQCSYFLRWLSTFCLAKHLSSLKNAETMQVIERGCTHTKLNRRIDESSERSASVLFEASFTDLKKARFWTETLVNDRSEQLVIPENFWMQCSFLFSRTLERTQVPVVLCVMLFWLEPNHSSDTSIGSQIHQIYEHTAQRSSCVMVYF